MMMMLRQSSLLLQQKRLFLLQQSQRTLSTTAAAAALSSLSFIRRKPSRRHRSLGCATAATANNVAFFTSSSSSMTISRPCCPTAFPKCTTLSFSLSSSVPPFSVQKQRCFISSSSSSSSSSSNNFITTTQQQSLRPIRVLYASAGGTAQLFAMHLVEQLQSLSSSSPNTISVSLESLADYPTVESMLLKNHHDSNNNAQPPPLYMFLLSTTGVGEPPGMAKKWYDSLMTSTTTTTNAQPLSMDYAIFGLGNSLAHPHHYNSVSKNVDQKLLELKCKPFLPLTLGDDGDCIEDDFDQWEALIVQTILLQNQNCSNGQEATTAVSAAAAASSPADQDEEVETPVVVAVNTAAAAAAAITSVSTTAAAAVSDDEPPRVRSCPGSTSPCGTRIVSSRDDKLSFLQLQAPTTEIVRPHLLDVAPSWYQQHHQNDNNDNNETVISAINKCHVLEQVLLNENAAANGLRELRLQLSHDVDHQHSYQAGDHIVLYPRNNDYMVEAYLRTLLKNVHPHAIIQGPTTTDNSDDNNNDKSNKNKKKYPHPTGITVFETLSHCVDLGATPSPSFSRLLMGLLPSDQQQLNYKKDIMGAGRTTLDLALEYQNENNPLSLEDILYNLPPLQPRYYSIASSQLLHPDKVIVTYRPVRYVTNRGYLREGLCTSFMVGLHGPGKDGGDGDSGKASYVLGAIRKNPTFRLPTDTTTSIVMIAGGCGAAPIRAFLEERLQLFKRNDSTDNRQPFFGDGLLFLGFRTPQDAVYLDLIQQALDAGALTSFHLSLDTGLPMNDPRRGTVTQSLGKHGLALWQHFEKGGYTYVCGGARTMGAAVERQIHEILIQYGNMTPDHATKYMRNMIVEGRLCEDLAD